MPRRRFFCPCLGCGFIGETQQKLNQHVYWIHGCAPNGSSVFKPGIIRIPSFADEIPQTTTDDRIVPLAKRPRFECEEYEKKNAVVEHDNFIEIELKKEREVESRPKSFELERQRPAQGTIECSICFDKESNAACVPCGHTGFCYDCLTSWKETKHDCPICRCALAQVLRCMHNNSLFRTTRLIHREAIARFFGCHTTATKKTNKNGTVSRASCVCRNYS